MWGPMGYGWGGMGVGMLSFWGLLLLCFWSGALGIPRHLSIAMLGQ